MCFDIEYLWVYFHILFKFDGIEKIKEYLQESGFQIKKRNRPDAWDNADTPDYFLEKDGRIKGFTDRFEFNCDVWAHEKYPSIEVSIGLKDRFKLWKFHFDAFDIWIHDDYATINSSNPIINAIEIKEEWHRHCTFYEYVVDSKFAIYCIKETIKKHDKNINV